MPRPSMILILRVPVLKFNNMFPTLSLRPAREVQRQLQLELRPDHLVGEKAELLQIIVLPCPQLGHPSVRGFKWRSSPSCARKSNLTSHLHYLHLSLKSAGFLVFVHSRAVFAQVCNGDRLVTATCSNTGRKGKKKRLETEKNAATASGSSRSSGEYE